MVSIGDPLGKDCVIKVKSDNRFIVGFLYLLYNFFCMIFVFPTLIASFAFMCFSLLIINVAGNSVHLSFV